MARSARILAILGPGILVAATGVGAGDLATAGLAGSRLGLAVLWAVVLGAAFKYIVSENLARYQLASGATVLEGAATRLGWWCFAPFVLYLVFWSFFVGSALISACGVTLQAILPMADPATGRLVYGVACSMAGVALAWLGGFRLFERVMAGSIAIMVAVVLACAVASRPDLGALLRGLAVPTIPSATDGGLTWTLALIGGVGGTLTLICYAYWMREAGREGPEHLSRCRLDLAIGFAVTALFGLAMIVIASGIELSGGGAGLIVNLANQLDDRLGPVARWAFLLGAFAAVFSSLLGVWQSVPYVIADTWALRHAVGKPDALPDRAAVSTRSRAYRISMLAIGTIPAVGLVASFEDVQRAYAVLGAFFVPGLAIALLLLNRASGPIKGPLANGRTNTALLMLTAAAVLVLGAYEAAGRLGVL